MATNSSLPVRVLLCVALCVPGLAQASAGDGMAALVCPGSVSTPLCQALATALDLPASEDTPKQAAADRLLIRFIAEHETADSLSGHLVWITAQGDTGRGPTLDLSVVDAGLNAQAMEAYAMQLVRLSKLPL
ncbi:hypothetical protein AB1M95_16125 [Sulfitobacter sp. LCG007]